ncbi:TLC domain family protein [Babesia bovis T2Bo]|uniref:TLC domain family protein n=1 Tax=Babesia bovis T2Bo TaxID=484906 RepID=UPI001C348D24|nr:TLC domain family protein [Babesia bovis T2Bo]EDO08116.2 TLC domain family protein [Babesia bovis T2Bo]
MTKTLENRIFSIYGILPHAELNDVYVVLAAMMFLTVLRLIFAGVNHKGKARWPSVFTVVIDKLQLAKKDKTYKMAESFWYLSWHVTSLTCTIAAFYEEYGTPENRRWLYYFLKDRKGIWFFSESIEDVMNKTITWPYITMTPKLRLLTLVSIGFWSSCCIYIFWETRRSDMRIMRFHHITTVSLLILDYVYSFHRIGTFVIILHDIPDVLLYTTKTLSYMQHAPEFLTAGFFVMYAMGHFFFRFVMMWKLVAYPFFGEMDTEEFYGGGLKYLWQLPGGIIGPCLLVVLTIMNTYWMNLIIGMMANFARGAKIEDEREKND